MSAELRFSIVLLLFVVQVVLGFLFMFVVSFWRASRKTIPRWAIFTAETSFLFQALVSLVLGVWRMAAVWFILVGFYVAMILYVRAADRTGFSWLIACIQARRHRETTAKNVVLPKQEEILERLRQVDNDDCLVERFYPLIAEEAGCELVAEGVAMMLTLKVHDFAESYPPPMGAFLSLYVPRFIDALVDDKEVAEDAKKWLKQVEGEAEARRKANTPPRVEPKEPIEDYEIYVAVRRVADIVFEYASPDVGTKGIWLEDRRNESVNPYYDQTESGLFLEFYYGQPSKVWTPWGYYGFSGSGSGWWNEETPKILERLGAILFSPEQNTKAGTIGPVYALHRVDGVQLPEPKLRERQNYLEYEVAKRAWENMTKRYKAEHKAI